MNPRLRGGQTASCALMYFNHEQELMARHFAGMTGMAMEERFHQPCWQRAAGPAGT